MHTAAECSLAVEGRARLAARLLPCCDRGIAEHVAVEAVPDVGGGLAVQQVRGPKVFADKVVDQISYAPVGAGRGFVPLLLTDLVYEPVPLLEGALVRVDQFHASMVRPTPRCREM
jgi:hypothetical protein